MHRRIAVATLVFTVRCGGSPFVADEIAAIDGESPAPTVDSGAFVVDAGETDAPTDKGPQDGGLDALIPLAEAGVDAAIPGSDGGRDGGELVDAGPACATKAPIAWVCASAATVLAPSEFCSNDLSAPYTISAQAIPAACASWCTYTCACLTAAYAGPLRVLGCSVAANGGLELNVD